jgi:hypothetical protein
VRLLLVVALALAAVLLWPRGSGEAPAGGQSAGGSEERRERAPARRERSVPLLRCAAGVDGCARVRGRVVFVEAVDPDGDGDLHVVIAGGGVTAPGLTAVDVSARLRPAEDPRVGDSASAAGPVQRGSFGQAQIHAIDFRLLRR